MKRVIIGLVGIVMASATATPVVTASTAPPDAVIEDYIGAFTESDPGVAQDYTQPDSPAYWYAAFKSAQAASSEQTGSRLEPLIVKAAGGEAELCAPEDPAQACATFAGFEADDAGRIVTFTINGIDIAPRLGPGGDPVDIDPAVSAQLLVSYRTVTDEALVVAVEVTASGAVDFDAEVNYRTDSRERIAVAERFGVTELESGTSVILLVFPASDPGGLVEWSVTVDGTRMNFVLPVPALTGPDDTTSTTQP